MADGADIMDCKAEASRRFPAASSRNSMTSYLPATLTASTEQLRRRCASTVAEVRQAGDDAPRPHPGHLPQGLLCREVQSAQNPAYLSAPTMEKLNKWQGRRHGLVKKIAVAPVYRGAVQFTADAVKSGASPWRPATPPRRAPEAQASALDALGAKVFWPTL